MTNLIKNVEVRYLVKTQKFTLFFTTSADQIKFWANIKVEL